MKKQRISIKGLSVWITCAIFFAYEFLLRTVLGTFEHSVTSDLNLSPFTFAIISSTGYQLIYALMQIPVAIIIQRLGLKKSLMIGTLVCAASVAIFSTVQGVYFAFILRVFMGFGASFGFLALLVSVYEWLPNDKTAQYIGLSQFIGTLGPMAAAGPLDSLISSYHINWRQLHLSLSVIGVILFVLVYFLVENNKRFISSFRILKRKERKHTAIRMLLQTQSAWPIAIYSASIYFAIEYLSENAGATYLLLNGYSTHFASYLITLAWFSYAIGCPLLGFISDKIGRRKTVMLWASLFAIVSVILTVYFPFNHFILVLSFCFLGIGASGQSIGFAIIAEQFKREYIPIGLGLNNALIGLFTAINAPLIGEVLSLLSPHHPPSITHYKMAFLVIVLMVSVAFFISIFIVKETFNKSRQDPYILNT